MNKHLTNQALCPVPTRPADKIIRVLIVDDSAVARKVLSRILAADPRIDVVGTAPDPFIARDKIKLLHPDVLTLDIEMPKMNGITFLRNLMRLRPMPVVMVSSYSVRGADVTLQALELGAVDFVTKPTADTGLPPRQFAAQVTAKVRAAAWANLQALGSRRTPLPEIEDKLSATVILPRPCPGTACFAGGKVIAIGSSTGGTEALKQILIHLPPEGPPVLITQHIPPVFCSSLVRRLNSLTPMTVREALDGQTVRPGHVYVAPGNQHLLLKREGSGYRCGLSNGRRVNRFKPSVDVLFRSVAQNAGQNSVGVILTGMGDDGARGMKEMHEAGAFTIAQDENTSVVWGMPGSAVKRGAVDSILPLPEIPAVLRGWPEDLN